MNLSLQAQPAKVLERRDDGSGRVRIPLGVVSTLDPSLTAGGGAGSLTLGPDQWREVVGNFGRRSRPVPVYFGHIADADRRTTPAAGFVEAVSFDGSHLWGDVDLGPAAFDAVVNQRGFRSASVELVRDAKTPTEALAGWALFGLAITNDPALPLEYSIAAASNADLASTASVRLTVALAPQKEHGMSGTVTLEGLQADKLRLEAEVAQRDQQIKALSAVNENGKGEVATIREEVGKLRLQLATIQAEAGAAKTRTSDLERALDASKAEQVRLQAELDKGRKEHTAREVTRIVRAAVGRGVDPALFDGAENDPAAWLAARFVSLEAFQSFADNLAGRKGRVVSNNKPLDNDNPDEPSPQLKDHLARLSVDPKYAGVQSESDLRALRAAQKG